MLYGKSKINIPEKIFALVNPGGGATEFVSKIDESSLAPGEIVVEYTLNNVREVERVMVEVKYKED